MSKKSRNVIFSESKKQRKTTGGYWGILGIGEGRAAHWGIWGWVNTIFHQTTENLELIGHCHMHPTY